MTKRILLVVLLTIASALVATAQTANVKDYYNDENKVGFKYPASWAAPAASLRGQLQEASVGLWVAGEMKPDKDVCMTFKDIHSDGQQNKPVTRKVGALTFYQMTNSDGGAGTFKTTNIYRVFHGGQCYNLSFETLARAPQDDRYVKAVNRQFDAILRSFYFGK
jgi:hypothetical protein